MPAQLDPGNNRQFLSRQYCDAVAAAGGLPLILPLLEPASSLASVAEKLDGVLLTGSNSDLDPALYGEVRQPACGPAHPLRDQTDFFLLEAAFSCRRPVFAICYGMQSLNVFCGGSLIQDIPASPGAQVRHACPESGGNPCHKIHIFAGSTLEQIAGSCEIGVNSTHHQAINRPGQGLTAIAHADDGVIEAVIHTDPGQWILGVQWHPEKSFDRDRFSRRLFELFVACCRAVRGER
jgi:putative glutamine amidotransferase